MTFLMNRQRVMTLLLLTLFSLSSFAGGFGLLESSARGMAQAYAGVTTGMGDGSSVYFNPAAMTLHDKPVFTVVSSFILPDAVWNDAGSYLNPALGNIPLMGGTDLDTGDLVIVPAVHMIYPFSENLVGGASLMVPYGLESEYDDDWLGRYHAIHSAVSAPTLNFSLAYQVNDRFSIGGSFKYALVSAELTNAIDFGTIFTATFGPEAAASYGLLPMMADGKGEIEGEDDGYGFNLGMLFTPTENTRIGIAYQSSMDTELQGEAYFTVPDNPGLDLLLATGIFQDGNGTAALELPDSGAIGITHRFGHHEVTFEAMFFGWSTFQELRVVYDNPAQPDTVEPEDYEDAWRYALGYNYDLGNNWILRAGIAIEETPIPGPHRRSPRIPDDERDWIGGGVSYQKGKFTFDASYQHLILGDGEMEHHSSTGDVLIGSYDLAVDIFAMSLSYHF